MSNLVLPPLPGIGIRREREPYLHWLTDESIGGREDRYTWWTSPRTRYRLDFNALRSGAIGGTTFDELQQLVTHFVRHFGGLDSFLLTDPDDCTVTDHGFAMGDGVTTTFQLQRRLMGAEYDVLGGPWASSSKPRTNLVTNSQALEAGTWGHGGAPTTANALVAPDGTVTANKITDDTSTGSHALTRSGFVLAAGQQVCGSFFAKAGTITTCYLNFFLAGTASANARFDLSAGTLISSGGAGGVTCMPQIVACPAPGWYRISVGFTVPVAGSWSLELWLVSGGQTVYAGSGGGCIYAWGAQVETGTLLPTAYIATSSTALTVSPGYWPALGGFEPVFDPYPGARVFQDGDWHGRRELYPVARTNLALYSQDLSNGAWVRLANGTGVTPTATAGAGTAPDGTATATRLQLDRGAGATSADWSRVAQTLSYQQGLSYTWSVWIKSNDGANHTIAVECVSGIITYATVTPQWQRFSSTWVATLTGSGAAAQLTVRGSYATDQAADLLVWGGQFEQGAAPTGYVATTSAAESRTDFTLSGLGQVTLAVAPAAGAGLSWTGGHWKRVRFDMEGLPLTRIVQGIWEGNGIQLVTVKP